MDPAAATAICTDLATALAALHRRGGAHGNVCADSIQVVGIAGDRPLAALGGPPLWRADPGAQERDLLDLGALLYYLLTGRRWQPGAEADLGDHVPRPVRGLLRGCLSRDGHPRTHTMQSMASNLEEVRCQLGYHRQDHHLGASPFAVSAHSSPSHDEMGAYSDWFLDGIVPAVDPDEMGYSREYSDRVGWLKLGPTALFLALAGFGGLISLFALT